MKLEQGQHFGQWTLKGEKPHSFRLPLSKNMIAGSQQSDRSIQQGEPLSFRGDRAGVHLATIIAQLWATVMDRVPLGYEDEVGFHLGVECASN